MGKLVISKMEQMTTSILITVLGSKDFTCDLGNFIQEMQELTGKMHLRNIEENSRKHCAATQEASTASVLCCHFTPTARGVCWSASSWAARRAPGPMLPVRSCLCQRVINSLLSLCASTAQPRAHSTPLSCRLKEQRAGGCAAAEVCRTLGNPGLTVQVTKNS